MQNTVKNSSSNLLNACLELTDYSDSESDAEDFKINSLSSATSSFCSLKTLISRRYNLRPVSNLVMMIILKEKTGQLS